MDITAPRDAAPAFLTSAGLDDSGMIGPNGKAGTAPAPRIAALSQDTSVMIDPNGHN